MEIIHVSAECYPVAKAGGLGDVVGALPKYLNQLGHNAKVVMPMYRTKFLAANEWEVVHESHQDMDGYHFKYAVIREKTNKLGFELYLVDIYGLLDRDKIYGYDDDTDRFVAFQTAVCDWIASWSHKPDVIHCHDHHTGFIPFMLKHCFAFQRLADVPTVFTIHNGQYQGQFGWERSNLLPAYDSYKWGMLEWNNAINPLASAVKCCWKVTTVSPSYLDELRYQAAGLEFLMQYEQGKCVGILNGIDNDVWNPSTDTFLPRNYDEHDAKEGKRKNKKELCQTFNLDPEKPLITFIGRLVGEKAADVLPDAIRSSIYHYHGNVNFLILGSGEPDVEGRLQEVQSQLGGFVNTYIGYNEGLSHLLYAGADFLLMPSRVEPCGLNQMYALRYGTVPMVRSTGGLKDTVKDFGDWQGFGIRFNHADVADVTNSVGRAVDLYYNKRDLFTWMRSYMMHIDHSWEASAGEYVSVYESLA
ncbi:glycogen synthase [Flavisolibacter nicotianae]|uniref:glycogen synthase n=1 Tax=Flavisolibacter nicotianae TaxID=2364882 RepID=UPI000EB11FF5|nr:glycogen synthase [Flavisolibacter nicotianae]